MSRALIQRSNVKVYEAAQAANVQKRKDLMEDVTMPASAKRRALLAIEADMQKNFADAQKTRAGHEAAALKEHAQAQPTSRLVAAAYDNPRAADEHFRIASWASAAEKIELARLAVSENDLVAAFALRRATANDQAISNEDRAAIGELVTQVTAPKARQADAELFAFRTEAARLDVLGWDCDILANSSKITEIANANALLPRENGSTHHVSTREARELLELAGVREPEPIAAAA